MFYNMKIKKLGNYVKITSTKIKLNQKSNNSFHTYSCKTSNNLVRAQNTIQDIVLANDFKYFFTLTFNPQYDRYNFPSLHQLFKNQLRVIRSLYNIDLSYIIVPEQHKNGAWHFHGFFNQNINKIFIENNYGYVYVPEFEVLGFHNFQKVKHLERASSYVTKYISKNLGKGINLYKHCFFCSKGLNRGLTIKDIVYNNEYFNNHFFDFKNDYCCKKILSLEEFRRISSIIDRLD